MSVDDTIFGAISHGSGCPWCKQRVGGKFTYQNRSLKNTFITSLFWILRKQDAQCHISFYWMPAHSRIAANVCLVLPMTVIPVMLLSKMCLELQWLFKTMQKKKKHFKCVFTLKCCSVAVLFQENILVTLARNLIESMCDIRVPA